jgi:hypothetical protein
MVRNPVADEQYTVTHKKYTEYRENCMKNVAALDLV